MPSRGEELDALASGARSLGVELAEEQASDLVDFLDVLYFWNRSTRLTSIVRAEAVRLHLLDSLSAAPALDSGTVADLGSGAGFPGVPLSVARPDIRFCLVESNRRRCSFLHEALRRLGRTNVSVLETDVETLVRGGRRFDTVVSRAFRPPLDCLELARELVPVGGRAIIMSGPQGRADVGFTSRLASAMALESERCLVLPSGNETRMLMTFRRVA